jgi:hypothetical protein
MLNVGDLMKGFPTGMPRFPDADQSAAAGPRALSKCDVAGSPSFRSTHEHVFVAPSLVRHLCVLYLNRIHYGQPLALQGEPARAIVDKSS